MSRDRHTRLVYSTGGEAEPEDTTPGRRQEDGSKIRIRLDRRASGRVATVITGLPGDDAAIAAFARDLRSACSTGGTVKDGVVELQGDHRREVEATLRAHRLRSKRAGV